MKQALVGAMMAFSAIGDLGVVAQTQNRVASPAGSSATEVGGQYDLHGVYVGGKWIEITFGRPIKRGRDLFDTTALFWAYDYTPDKDVVRMPMTLEVLSHSFDQLSWEFLDVTDTGGRLALLWDTQLASVSFTITK